MCSVCHTVTLEQRTHSVSSLILYTFLSNESTVSNAVGGISRPVKLIKYAKQINIFAAFSTCLIDFADHIGDDDDFDAAICIEISIDSPLD